jgi:hypothetical protein
MNRRQERLKLAAALALTGLISSCTMPVSEPASAPAQACAFLGLTNLADFTRNPGSHRGESVWLSPEIPAPIAWNELVASWNAPPATALRIEARALAQGWASRYYTLGEWSLDPARFPRRSIKGQKDAEGEVRTDTLVLSRLAQSVQVRLTIRSLKGTNPSPLKFLGLSFLNSTATAAARPPNKAAWGRALPVPLKAQLAYAGGRDWCSPTCVAMVLAHWAAVLGRSDLNVDAPEAARHIHDPTWGGTGNWPFNTAYAGSLTGMRAYVTRFKDLTEVEGWIAAGVPVVLSVSFDRLNGKAADEGTGHLIVCVGFTEAGDVVVNDPWAPKDRPSEVRQVHPRSRVIAAWARSRQTVYLIYPETLAGPS